VATIEVNTKALREAGDILNRVSKLIAEVNYQAGDVQRNLRDTTSINEIQMVLRKKRNELERLTYVSKSLGQFLEETAYLYDKAENKLQGYERTSVFGEADRNSKYITNQASNTFVDSARADRQVLRYINII